MLNETKIKTFIKFNIFFYVLKNKVNITMFYALKYMFFYTYIGKNEYNKKISYLLILY